MIIILQPEVAYIKKLGRIIDSAEAPDGYLWRSHWQNIPDNATQEELFKFMKAFLIPLEEHD